MYKILVIGGCGYIGSYIIVDFIDNGFDVILVDNFSNFSEEVFDGIEIIIGCCVKNYVIDFCDFEVIEVMFREYSDFVGVIYFVVLKYVGELVD